MVSRELEETETQYVPCSSEKDQEERTFQIGQAAWLTLARHRKLTDLHGISL